MGGGKGKSTPLCRRAQAWFGYSFGKIIKGSGPKELTLEALRRSSKLKLLLFSSCLCFTPSYAFVSFFSEEFHGFITSLTSPSTTWLSRPSPLSDLLPIESLRDLGLLGQ